MDEKSKGKKPDKNHLKQTTDHHKMASISDRRESQKKGDEARASTHKDDKKGESSKEIQPETEKVENASVPEIGIETLRALLAKKMGFADDDEEAEEVPKILDEPTLDGVIKYIVDKKCKNIITLAGAGISTSAGIPDFRSPGTGLYDNLQKYNLPHPQAIFELEFFNNDPKPFFELAKELYPGKFKPTPCHYFVRMLNEKGLLLRHYTQNIDTLERIAEIPEDKLIEAHGTFFTGHCLKCRKKYSLPWMKERIFRDEIPTCDCKGVVKPDIVFFGENLPHKFHKSLESDFPKCDLLIILGSSLAVQPFASLVDRAPLSCPRLLVNREKVGQRSGIFSLLGMGSGMSFDKPGNSRDVAWLGDCDDGCQLIADKLGWGDELKALIKKEHKKIDAKAPEK